MVKQLLSYVILAFGLASAVVAAPAPAVSRRDGSLLIPAPNVIPSIWQQVGETITSSSYTFTVTLVNGNLAGLTTRMEQIAADGKGQWLTEDELMTYTQPSSDTTTQIMSYLTSQGIPASAISTNKYGDQVTVTTTIEKTASIFAAQFFNFNVHGTTVPRTKGYTIPSVIAPHIVDVSPLANFASIRHTIAVQKPDSVDLEVEEREESSNLFKRAAPSSCSTSKVTPQCLKDYYGTTSYSRSTGSSAKPDVGVMGYIDQYVSQSDLTSFLNTYSSSASSYQIPINLRDGATNDANSPGVEAMLDVETVVSQIYPLTAAFYAEGNSQTSGDIFAITFNDFLNNYNSANVPKIITISYGGDENQMTSSQATAMCTSAQKLTSLGTTIVVSSGDYGVAGQNDKCPPWTPTYPSGCSYILSIGATQDFNPEVMVNPSLAGFYSGAGASNFFSIPSYQTSDAAAYEKIIGTQKGDYSQKGRLYPDVAAQGSNYVVIVGGQSQIVGGTSASAPLTSSLLAMINDERAKAGSGTIGWANPSIYSSPLHDITSGGSYGCGSSTTLGFAAETGFDGASGNGSPYFSALNTAFSA